MNILVTGGFGFIGSNICKTLEDNGAKVWALDNFYCADFRNLEGFKGEVVIADILDEGFLKKLPSFDGVIHEAAITDTTLEDDSLMLRVNFEGFKNILSFCLRKNVKHFVYASSAGVYGDGPSPMKEDQRLRPLNSYAYSKFLCDRFILAHKTGLSKKISIVGLRYFNVYGPGEQHKEKSSSMIYQLYLQMREGRRPRIFKYGQQKRDFVYVKDVVGATLNALKFRGVNIVNVGTGRARSFNEIIRIINKVLKKNFKPQYFENPYKGVYQDFTQADINKLLSVLKYQPRYSLERGIRDYIGNLSRS